jgi:hypothetical protein
MLAIFVILYLKAGLKAVRVERGLGLFIRSLRPSWQIRHARRIFTSYRNACIEEGRKPWLARIAHVSLVLALVGVLAGLALLLLG